MIKCDNCNRYFLMSELKQMYKGIVIVYFCEECLSGKKSFDIKAKKEAAKRR